jgi:hypothetical protein
MSFGVCLMMPYLEEKAFILKLNSLNRQKLSKEF